MTPPFPHPRARALALGVTLLAAGLTSDAHAGSFDGRGRYGREPTAVLFEGFEAEPERYLPASLGEQCQAPGYETVWADDALEGQRYLRLTVAEGCSERFVAPLPAVDGSYRASLWMRHGSLDAQLAVEYRAEANREPLRAKLFPTGRMTSDGWVELASNEFPVDGASVGVAYLQVTNFADREGVDVDALELVAQGEHVAVRPCRGVGDPICSAEEVCIYQQCRLERLSVPPLPADEVRHSMVDVMQSQLRLFFGGRKTRLEDLPAALDRLEAIRTAETAWEFWNGFAHAIRLLHDWHTRISRSSGYASARVRRLNVCFIEGEADRSEPLWPNDPRYKALLVSHVGQGGTHGIATGDHLVAVDGQHPIAWALGLRAVDWGFWQAADRDVYTEFAERMRDLIIAYASEFSVIHCHAATGSCDPTPETYAVRLLPEDPGELVSCDNRPYYHLDGDRNPDPDHHVGYQFFRGPIAGTSPEEAIFGMIWDTLFGGGDPEGWVNQNISQAIEEWKAGARGVILDHRAGNGGTLDAVDNLARLVRPVETIAVDLSPLQLAAFDGPATASEGLALFNVHRVAFGWTVGADDHDPALPVALVTHRDGSASDYLPFALQGSPKVRLFGPHGTAGAFSTFLSARYWGGLNWQFASGEPVTSAGAPLIGHGVVPDELVDQRQSDLLAGIDTIHEAALAWVRQELKP